MYCLREFAKHYYDRFHNPLRMFVETKRGFLLVPILILFLIYFSLSVEQLLSRPDKLGFSLNLGMAMLFELLGVIAYFFAKKAADEKSSEYIFRVFARKFDDISQAKTFYLKAWLKKESLHVGETVNNISLAIGFIENDGYFFSSRPRSLSELVFSHSASARIISLFIALCAITLTLSVSNGANLDYVFAFYDTDISRIIGIYVVAIVLLVGVYFSLRQIVELIYGAVRWLGAVFLNKDFGGVEVLRIFARDIMFYASDSLYENGGEE